VPNDNDALPLKKKRMTAANKKSAHSMMVALTGAGKRPDGDFLAIAACFSVHQSTCMRLWKQIQVELDKIPSNQDDDNDDEEDNVLLDKHIPSAVFETKMSQRRKGKYKHDREAIKAKVKAIPFSKRRRTRMLAAQLEMPQSTIMRIFKQQGSIFKCHTNSLKPKLTEDNQRVRLQFALSKID